MRESYQIRVNIIEARSLRGSNESKGFSVSPRVKIRLTAGEGPNAIDETKYTSKVDETNSAFWNEVRIFQQHMSREAFNTSKLEVAVEDSGLFTNTLIGAAQFDLVTVYEYPAHEVFGLWVALTDEEKGQTVQGFLRLSITVLREGDTPKIHGPNDLDDGLEPDVGVVMGMPEINMEGYLLVVRINKVEVAPYGIEKPAVQVRMRFGATEIKSRVARTGFEALINDELRLPVFTPTLTDRIVIDCIDTKFTSLVPGMNEKILCSCTLSCRDVMRDMLVTQWRNMYGVRPLPKVSALGAIGRVEDESAEDTAYRGRILLYAACEKPKPEEQLQVIRLPMIFSKAEVEALAPRQMDYALRCDLYDGSDFVTGPLDSVYVVVALGPVEKRSAACAVTDGVVRFESDEPGKEGYYEQLEEIRVKMPDDPTQHYDIFVHVYVAGPLGDRRIGYQRYQTKTFIQDLESGGPPPTPKWVLLLADPLCVDEMQLVSTMLQFTIVFGPEKTVSALPRKRMRIPKLRRYELTAKIYQAQGLVPSDDNGLADPFVKIALGNASLQTETVTASLNPIWYQPLTLHCDLPGDLTLAPKIMVTVYDSDPAPLGLGVVPGSDFLTSAQPIGRSLAPPGSYSKTVREYYNKPQATIKPEWIDLYDPLEAKLDFEPATDPAALALQPQPCGKLLCSFDLRPSHGAGSDDTDGGKRKKKSKSEGANGSGDIESAGPSAAAGTAGSLKPPSKLYLVEISVVGLRDMQPREIFGVPVELQAPYVEFEYGERSAEQNTWQTHTANSGSASSGSMPVSSGANINLLETKYLRVELPLDAKLYEPMMGIRVRESSRLKLPFIGQDPIMGISSINLLEEMPEYQEKLKEERAAASAKAQATAEAEAKAAQEGSSKGGEEDNSKIDPTPNETMLRELFLSSALKASTSTRSAALKKADTPTPGVGARTIAEPEAQDPLLQAGAEDDDEQEGEGEEDDADEPTITKPLEDTLPDKPFKDYVLSNKPPKQQESEQRRKLHQMAQEYTMKAIDYVNVTKLLKDNTPREAGLLKMKVRVIEEATSAQFLKEEPAINLRRMYAERPCKVRVYVYNASGLSPRNNGSHPQPFLKVYNNLDRVRTTRDIATPPSLDPEFFASFELAALLPGQSRLHLEVWDFTLLSERLIGGTTIDLEDRLFSKEWLSMQMDGALPREIRPLRNPGNANNQGFITCKVEILEKKFATANPMVPIDPPTYDMFELRVIVWDAVDVKAKDEAFFGGGGTSDVFVTVQPIGSQPYNMQKTDVHWRSPGDAEFNWRMVWPIALPEKAPRLFLQIWDADILSADDAIGEAQITLKPLCDRALKRGGNLKLDNIFVPCTHPNFKGSQGTVRVTIELLPRGEAMQKPVGLGRSKPNQHPFLMEPVRPSLFDGLGIDFNFLNPFYFFKKYAVVCCICCIIVAAVGVVFFMMSS